MANTNTFLKADINIRNSVNTDTVNEDIYIFGDPSAQLIQNNGIERDGGITNVYEVETALAPNSTSFITPEGDIIKKGWDGLVTLKSTNLGYVSPYSVQDMCSIKQVDDVVLSSYNKTYITAKLVNNTIQLFEYDIATTPVSGNPFGDNEITYDSAPTVGVFPSTTLYPSTSLYPSSAGDALHTRSIAITVSGITDVSAVYTSLSIIRTDTLTWNDSIEFLLRIDTNVYKISEAAPAAPILFTSLLSGYTQLNYLYGYNYTLGNYLVNLVGNSLNKSFIITNWGTSTKTDIRCRYAVPQTSGVKTRHLITCDPLTDGTRTKSAGYVGYTDFITFSATEVWPAFSSTFNTATYTQPIYFNTGFGYSEYVIKTTASNNYTNVYVPNFITDSTAYIHSTQSNNTSLLWNYYGKLNNFNSLAPSRSMEFRVNVVNGTQAYLSVAKKDVASATNGTNDLLGVNLTEVGAFDDSYQPQVMTDNTILYKAYDNFYVVAIDYDAGAGYFNSSTWAEATIAGTTTVDIANATISTSNITTTPSITIPMTTTLRGGQYPYITIRYKTNDPNPLIMQYSNSQHTYSGTYQKSITPIADGEWHVQVFNMTILDIPNADYVSYDLTGIKLLMGSTIGASWSLFSIYISYKTLRYVPQVQKISDAAYKINTIDALNIVNIRTGLLEPGSIDYHGQMSFAYSGAQATIPYRTVSSINSVFSNSIDAGEKITNCDLNVSPPTTVISAIGTRLIGNLSYSTDIYTSPITAPASVPIYTFSVKGPQTELIDPSKTNTPYQANSVLPIPMGYRYKEFAVYARSSTIFYNTTNPISIGNIGQGTSVGYDGYTLGNDIPGTYVPFYLLGTRYAQDLVSIYQVNFVDNIFQGYDRIAPSIGMNYIGSAPDVIYFLSQFDNSIYTFTGNRTLAKQKRFSQISPIENGLYSTKDNTLLLNSTTDFVWTRDGITTINPKKFNQDGTMTLFETRDGLIIMNDYYFWAYTYNIINFDAVYNLVPLVWQHAHFGLKRNQKSILSEFVFTILNTQATTKASFNITIYSKDENDNYIQQNRLITLWPKDFNSSGYASFRVKPQEHHSIATSVKLEQTGTNIPKIILIDAIAVFNDESNAVLSARKTR